MRDWGVNHYTTKPIKRQELCQIIAEALSKRGGSSDEGYNDRN
jgi:DNA-binding response OmpR family regulator